MFLCLGERTVFNLNIFCVLSILSTLHYFGATFTICFWLLQQNKKEEKKNNKVIKQRQLKANELNARTTKCTFFVSLHLRSLFDIQTNTYLCTTNPNNRKNKIKWQQQRRRRRRRKDIKKKNECKNKKKLNHTFLFDYYYSINDIGWPQFLSNEKQIIKRRNRRQLMNDEI